MPRHTRVVSAFCSWQRVAYPLIGGVLLAAVGAACSGGSKEAAAKPAATTKSAMRRFAADSFTAVSDRDYWLLGRVPCAAGRCAALFRTSDGGKSFVKALAPPLPQNGSVPMLRFADGRDGYAYVPQVGGAFYATHDGGAHWRRMAFGTVLQFTTAGGYAYAVTARCSTERCTRYRFRREAVTTNRWTARPLPFRPDGSLFGLAALGSKVWLLGTRTGKETVTHGALARSSDSGRTFVTGSASCYAGLGGELAPASAQVIWAVCPTGLLAGAWRSRDGGVTFTRLRTPALANSALVAAASERAAVLFANAAGARLLRTTDGGRTWRPAQTPQRPADIQSLSFTSATVALALVQADDSQTNELWRTTDGGADWTQVRLP